MLINDLSLIHLSENPSQVAAAALVGAAAGATAVATSHTVRREERSVERSSTGDFSDRLGEGKHAAVVIK